MQYDRHQKTIYKGMKTYSRPVEELLDAFRVHLLVPDDEFAADMRLLTSGKMSPEEHRLYLRKKYAAA